MIHSSKLHSRFTEYAYVFSSNTCYHHDVNAHNTKDLNDLPEQRATVLMSINPHGRLGNLMFEHAAGYGIARKHNFKFCTAKDSDEYSFSVLQKTFLGPFPPACEPPSRGWLLSMYARNIHPLWYTTAKISLTMPCPDCKKYCTECKPGEDFVSPPFGCRTYCSPAGYCGHSAAFKVGFLLFFFHAVPLFVRIVARWIISLMWKPAWWPCA